MKNILIIGLLAMLVGCKTETSEVKKSPVASVEKEISSVVYSGAGITVNSYDFEGLKPLLQKKDETIHIINFWATWCAPCIKELPHFEKIGASYKDKNVEVLLVSLDFPKKVESQLIPYIKKHNLQSEVVLLDDPKQNTWIPKVSEEWSGGIPATVIYNKDKRVFFERSFTYEELEEELKHFFKLGP